MAPHSEAVSNGSEDGPVTNGISTTISNGIAHLQNGMQHTNRSEYLVPSTSDSEFDLVCVGFGPAGLSIAAALHDSFSSGTGAHQPLPKAVFIEKQGSFAWHAGMLLPGTKMQISFVKDLATLRNPRSRFTFLNYLHNQGRLVDFTNLDTFLPSRVEYGDYLKWCASFFENVVQYDQQVVSVSPEASKTSVRSFTVTTKDVQGQIRSYRGRNIILATGGQPLMPSLTTKPQARVIHSSEYAYKAPQILPNTSAPYRIAVLGAGQSAAEIFYNLQNTYPNAQVWLVMRQEFLRPSDDSPFINSIFNPEYTDCMFNRSAQHRNSQITDARATNYGVVRITLLEQLYEHMYNQKRELGPDERKWPHRILGASHITSTLPGDDGRLALRVERISSGAEESVEKAENLEADLVIAATGYQRRAHVEMLREAWDLLPKAEALEDVARKEGIEGWNVETMAGQRRIAVGRDYGIKFERGVVKEGSGVWLQGCCEGTHGLSDTLLSVLAARSGEIVDSIFGKGK